MSDFEMILHEGDGLVVTFLADGDIARVELRASGDWDLMAEDDVVVAIDGEGVEVDCRSKDFAVAVLGDLDLERPIELMIRVGEFFEGWELG